MTKNAAVDITHSIRFVSQRAMTVFIALASFSNKNNTCFPSIDTIAERCNLSGRTVQRAIADLIAMELVEKVVRFREDNGYTSNLYTLVDPQEKSNLSDASRQAVIWDGDSVTSEYEYSNMNFLTCSSLTDSHADNNVMENNQNTQINNVMVENTCNITLDKILDNCELPYISVNYGEDFSRILRNAVQRLYYSDRLRVGNAVLPQSIIRESMGYLNYHTLEAAIDRLKYSPKRDIKNGNAYVATLLFNTITEADINLITKLSYA